MGWVTARWILSREPEPEWIEAFMQGRDDTPWQACHRWTRDRSKGGSNNLDIPSEG